MDPIIWEKVTAALRSGDPNRVRHDLGMWVQHCQAEGEFKSLRILIAGTLFFADHRAHEDTLAYAAEANRLLAQLPEMGPHQLEWALRAAGLSKIPDEDVYRRLAVLEGGAAAVMSARTPEGRDPEEYVNEIKGRLSPHTGGCFVATAALGSTAAPELVALRRFRDLRLRTSAAGRSVVRVYERCSPGLARWIANRPLARAVVRVTLIRPATWLLRVISGL